MSIRGTRRVAALSAAVIAVACSGGQFGTASGTDAGLSVSGASGQSSGGANPGGGSSSGGAGRGTSGSGGSRAGATGSGGVGVSGSSGDGGDTTGSGGASGGATSNGGSVSGGATGNGGSVSGGATGSGGTSAGGASGSAGTTTGGASGSSNGGSGGATGAICGGLLGTQCPNNDWCDYDDSFGNCGGGDGSGVCKPRPPACPLNYAPVCGCDGHMYSNACMANAAGMDTSTDTSCMKGDGGAGATCGSDNDCSTGLKCCYPCGIPGCQNQCMQVPGSTCPLIP